MYPTHQLQIHRFTALSDGPRLIVTGAVHGNEVAGTRAIERVLGELMRGEITLARGALTLLPVCNPLAHAHGRRDGERNLNRRLRPTAAPADNEDRIANVLCPLLAAHDVLLDLHSFSGPGQPFVLRGPADNRGPLEPFAHAAAEARLAAHMGPERIVDGWMDVYAAGVACRRARIAAAAGGADAVAQDIGYGIGTTEYMRSVGGYGVTLECGPHDDAAAPGIGWRAIRQALALLGLAELALSPPAPRFECLSLVEVVDRHDARDTFVRPWRSFDPLAKGEPIARRADGSALCAAESGFIVFPYPGALPGREWFYLARPSERPL